MNKKLILKQAKLIKLESLLKFKTKMISEIGSIELAKRFAAANRCCPDCRKLDSLFMLEETKKHTLEDEIEQTKNEITKLELTN